MSLFYFGKKKIRGNALGEESSFPGMRNALGQKIESRTDEEDGLHLGYGQVPNILPHTMQDRYGGEERELEFDM